LNGSTPDSEAAAASERDYEIPLPGRQALALLRLPNREPRTMSNEHIIGARFEQIGLACCREEVSACLEQAKKQALAADPSDR
jgi:hypothetical protein